MVAFPGQALHTVAIPDSIILPICAPSFVPRVPDRFLVNSRYENSTFLFAVLTTGYILTAIQFEEKDLKTNFGEKYKIYKQQVAMIIPFTKRKAANINRIKEERFNKVYEENMYVSNNKWVF